MRNFNKKRWNFFNQALIIDRKKRRKEYNTTCVLDEINYNRPCWNKVLSSIPSSIYENDFNLAYLKSMEKKISSVTMIEIYTFQYNSLVSYTCSCMWIFLSLCHWISDKRLSNNWILNEISWNRWKKHFSKSKITILLNVEPHTMRYRIQISYRGTGYFDSLKYTTYIYICCRELKFTLDYILLVRDGWYYVCSFSTCVVTRTHLRSCVRYCRVDVCGIPCSS